MEFQEIFRTPNGRNGTLGTHLGNNVTCQLKDYRGRGAWWQQQPITWDWTGLLLLLSTSPWRLQTDIFKCGVIWLNHYIVIYSSPSLTLQLRAWQSPAVQPSQCNSMLCAAERKLLWIIKFDSVAGDLVIVTLKVRILSTNTQNILPLIITIRGSQPGRLIMIMTTQHDDSSVLSHHSWASLLVGGALRRPGGGRDEPCSVSCFAWLNFMATTQNMCSRALHCPARHTSHFL